MTDPDEACACGTSHTSMLAAIYCAEQMETEAIEARKPPKVKRPSVFIRSEN